MLPLCPWAVGGGLKRGWAGLSCAPRALTGHKAGLEQHCQGVLSSEALPQCPGALWKSLPAVLTLCRVYFVRSCTESGLEETHGTIQSNRMTLLQFDQNLAFTHQMELPFQANFNHPIFENLPQRDGSNLEHTVSA